MNIRSSILGLSSIIAPAVVLALGVAACAGHQGPEKQPEKKREMKQEHRQDAEAKQQEMMAMLQEQAQADGYLQAHKDVKAPLGLLGGPIRVRIRQASGGVFVALPDHRKLDPDVFGTPDLPQQVFGTPGITGVPPVTRGVEKGQLTTFKHLSPFGDKHAVMRNGKLEIQATDATAADAAETGDSVRFAASWEDEKGNTYEVRCCEKVAAHGVEYPSFGGVVTNHLMHGWTGVGTPLMPTEFAYFAFWGTGEVRKNGESVDKPRLVHGMLSEYVRVEGYDLGFDTDVTPKRVHFHLMVPPFMPADGKFEKKPVDTGFTLPDGQPLPFWHVMFENLEISAERQ